MPIDLTTSISVPALIGTWLGIAAQKGGYEDFSPLTGGLSGGFLGLMFYVFSNLNKENNKHSIRKSVRIASPGGEKMLMLTKEENKNNNEKKLKSDAPPSIVLNRVVTSI